MPHSSRYVIMPFTSVENFCNALKQLASHSYVCSISISPFFWLDVAAVAADVCKFKSNCSVEVINEFKSRFLIFNCVFCSCYFIIHVNCVDER